MKILIRFAVLIVFLCSVSFAEDLPVCGSENALPGASCRGRDVGLEDNQRISIYLHPVTLISTLAVKEVPLFLYLTGEFPLSRFNSLIVNPSLWTGSNDNGLDFLRVGSGVGIRRFANGEANGLYLQLMGSLHYLSIEQKIYSASASISGPLADILGYIGYSAKYSGISVFFDFGLGYSFSSIKAKGSIDDDSWAYDLGNNAGLALDINIGLGIPF